MTCVFPRVRRKLNAFGIDLVEVDLRWGITEEQSHNAEALYRCLYEIDRCRDSAVFFLGLLGNHYGQVPSKDALDKCSALLNDPRISRWSGLSYTEIEMQYAVLSAGVESQISSLFLTRSYELTIQLAPAHSVMASSQNRLCEHVRECASNVRQYTTLDQMSHYTESFILERLQVEHDHNETGPSGKNTLNLDRILKLRKASGKELAGDQEFGSLDIHSKRSIARRRFFDSSPYNTALLERMNGASILVVKGPDGSGKSTFISNYIHDQRKAASEFSCFEFFCSSTSKANFEEMVDKLCAATGYTPAATGVANREKFSSPRIRFMECLETLDDGRHLKIAIYNAHLLSPPWNSLSWLPNRLPKNIQLFVSTSEPPKIPCEVVSFDVWNDIQHRRTLIRNALNWYGKTVTDTQLEHLVSENHEASPLLLTDFVKELRFVSNRELVNETIDRLRRTRDAAEVHDHLMERLECYFGYLFTRNALSYLTVSHFGLTDIELAELCGSSNDVIDSFLGQIVDKVELIHGLNRVVSDQFEQAIRHRYFSDDGQETNSRLQLRHAFSDRTLTRCVLEVVHQTNTLELRKDLRQMLVNPSVLFQLMENQSGEIKNYWQTLDVPYHKIGEQYKPIIVQLMRFRVEGIPSGQIGQFNHKFCQMLAAFDAYELLRPLARRWYLMGHIGVLLSHVPVFKRYVKKNTVLTIRGNMAFQLADIARNQEHVARSLRYGMAAANDLYRAWEKELIDEMGVAAPAYLLAMANHQISLFDDRRGKGHTSRALGSARAATDIIMCVPGNARVQVEVYREMSKRLSSYLLHKVSRIAQKKIQEDEKLQHELVDNSSGRISLKSSAFEVFRCLIPRILAEHPSLNRLHTQVNAGSRYLIDFARLELGEHHNRTSTFFLDHKAIEWFFGEISDEYWEKVCDAERDRIVARSGKLCGCYMRFLLDRAGLYPLMGKTSAAHELALEAKAIAAELGIPREVRRADEQLDFLAFATGDYDKVTGGRNSINTSPGVKFARFIVWWTNLIEDLGKQRDWFMARTPRIVRPAFTMAFHYSSKTVDILSYPLLGLFLVCLFVGAPCLLTLPGPVLYSWLNRSDEIPLPIWSLAFGFFRGLIMPRNYPGDTLIEMVLPRIGCGILHGIFGTAIGYAFSGWIPTISSPWRGFFLGVPAFALLDITRVMFLRAVSQRKTTKIISLVRSADLQIGNKPMDEPKMFVAMASYLIALEKANHLRRSADLRAVIVPRIAYIWHRLGRNHQFENVLDYLIRGSSLSVTRSIPIVLLSQNVDQHIQEIRKTDPDFVLEQHPDFVVLEAVCEYRKGYTEKALSGLVKALKQYGLDPDAEVSSHDATSTNKYAGLAKVMAFLGSCALICFKGIIQLFGIVWIQQLNLSVIAMIYYRAIRKRHHESPFPGIDQQIRAEIAELATGNVWHRLYLLRQIRELDSLDIPELEDIRYGGKL